jgi:hypothetical protein
MFANDCRMAANDTKRRSRTRRKPAPAVESSQAEAPAPAGVLTEYMDTAELAAELDLKPLTLIRWRLQKTGPPVTWLGRRLIYRRSSVQAWLAAQEKQWA